MKKIKAIISLTLVLALLFTLIACTKTEEVSESEAKALFLDAYSKTIKSTNLKVSSTQEKKFPDNEGCVTQTILSTITGNSSDTKVLLEYSFLEYDDPDDKTSYRKEQDTMFLGKGDDDLFYQLIKFSSSTYASGLEVIPSRQASTDCEVLEKEEFMTQISVYSNPFDPLDFSEDLLSIVDEPTTQIDCVKTTKMKKTSYSVNIVFKEEMEGGLAIKYIFSSNISDELIQNFNCTVEYYNNDVLENSLNYSTKIQFEYNVPDLTMPNLSEYKEA